MPLYDVLTPRTPASCVLTPFTPAPGLAFALHSASWSAYTPYTEGVAASEHTSGGRATARADTLAHHAVPGAGNPLDAGPRNTVSDHAGSIANETNHSVTTYCARAKHTGTIASCAEGDTQHAIATFTSANDAGVLDAFAPYAGVCQAVAYHPGGADDRYVV